MLVFQKIYVRFKWITPHDHSWNNYCRCSFSLIALYSMRLLLPTALEIRLCTRQSPRKSVFSLMCVGKLLPRRNCRNNIHVNFRINYCKKNLHFDTLSGETPIISIINNKRKKMKEKPEKVYSMDKTLLGTEESAGAVIPSCSVNKVFWKIAQNPLEYTCAGVSF